MKVVSALGNRRTFVLFVSFLILLGVVLAFLAMREVERERLLWEKTKQDEALAAANRSIDLLQDALQETEAGVLKQLAPPLEPDDREWRDILGRIVSGEDLVAEIFIARTDRPPEFPLFVPLYVIQSSPPPGRALREIVNSPLLAQAEACEFREKNYGRAFDTYSTLYGETSDKNARAQILNRMARSLKSSGRFERAVETYRALVRDFDSEHDEEGLCLGLLGRFQITAILEGRGETVPAVESCLDLAEGLLNGRWRPTRSQFFFYRDRVSQSLPSLLKKISSPETRTPLEDRWQAIEAALTEKTRRTRAAEVLAENMRSRPLPEGSGTEPSAADFSHDSFISDGEWFVVGRRPLAEGDALGIRFDNEALLERLISGNIPGAAWQVRVTDDDGLLNPASTDVVASSRFAAAPALRLESPLPPWTVRLIRTGSSDGESAFRTRRLVYLGIVFVVVSALGFGGFMGLRGMAKEIEIARLKSDFVATVSHELRTPLASIRYMLDLLKSGRVPGEEKKRAFYETLDVESERLALLIENLLDFSKIEAGMKEYRPERIDTVAFTHDVAERFRQRIAPKGFTLETDFPENLPPVKADRESLERALHNLLDNAFKYSGAERTIHFKARTTDGFVSWEIHDHGIGIDAAEREQIFDRFYRSPRLSDPAVRGSGVGLTIVRHVAEAHGGAVEVASEKGRGSTFFFKIPRER